MRPPGWESRLAAVLKDAGERAYDPRRWNCARFAHRCAEAVSLRSIPFAFVGGSLEASADAVLPRVEPRQARRGDVVLAQVPHDTLGVCAGRVAVFLGRNGLERYPMTAVRAAWSV